VATSILRPPPFLPYFLGSDLGGVDGCLGSLGSLGGWSDLDGFGEFGGLGSTTCIVLAYSTCIQLLLCINLADEGTRSIYAIQWSYLIISDK
jgi:hypothetical protein